MGRVWGDCKWHGREVQWKQHLEEEHRDKLFATDSADLVWNMGMRRKPLTGYYVFQAHDEMFNFYEIYDKQRILFTMTCTSNRRESKYNYAYEVTLLQPDNEAVSLTQKFPVHSEYDKDILMEGTCVSIGLSELARFVDDDKVSDTLPLVKQILLFHIPIVDTSLSSRCDGGQVTSSPETWTSEFACIHGLPFG